MTEEMVLVENTIQTLDYLKTERKKHEANWEEVQKYVAPSVLSFGNLTDKIPKRPKRFTGKPANYLETMVAGITGYSVSPNIVWLKMSLENTDQLGLYGVKDWLEKCERVFYAAFGRSNIYLQTPKLVEYGGLFGHGAMLIDEDLNRNRLRFITIPERELYFNFNEYDEIDVVYREFTMTVANAAKFFGLENMDEQVQIDHKDKNKRNNEITILHAVYPREEYDEEKPDGKNMPFASLYIDQTHKHLIEESGYHEFPYAILLWDKIVGTAYSESPAIHALDDILMLSKTEDTRLRIAQLSAEPPMNVHDNMRGSENVVPRGYNYFKKPEEMMMPINTGANYPISLEITREYEARVKNWFHVDFFLMLQAQGDVKNMTATAVTALQGEKAAVLSNLITSLNSTLQAIVQRCFGILYRQGKIPPIPESLQGVWSDLKVGFVGPLAQAQKKYLESGGIAQGLNFIAGLANLAPQTLDIVDFDKLTKIGLEGTGVPQTVIREDEDTAKIRQMRAEQQAQAQQQAAAMQQSQNLLGNLDKLNQKVEQGSTLEGLNQLAGGGM
jgi:hypothetical protein